MNNRDVEELREAFDHTCQAVSELERALYPFRGLRQLINKPLQKLSATEKLRIARDILALKEEN